MARDSRHRACGSDVSLGANSGKGGFQGMLGKEYIRTLPFHAGLGALHGS